MKFRHRLLVWLAGGDMVFMNAEFMRNGAVRAKECGDILIYNNEFHSNAPDALRCVTNADRTEGQAALILEFSGRRNLWVYSNKFAGPNVPWLLRRKFIP